MNLQSIYKDRPKYYITIGHFFIVWFNDCVLGKSGQIENPIIVNVDPLLYYSIYIYESINCKHRENSHSQLIDTRN